MRKSCNITFAVLCILMDVSLKWNRLETEDSKKVFLRYCLPPVLRNINKYLLPSKFINLINLKPFISVKTNQKTKQKQNKNQNQKNKKTPKQLIFKTWFAITLSPISRLNMNDVIHGRLGASLHVLPWFHILSVLW